MVAVVLALLVAAVAVVLARGGVGEHVLVGGQEVGGDAGAVAAAGGGVTGGGEGDVGALWESGLLVRGFGVEDNRNADGERGLTL